MLVLKSRNEQEDVQGMEGMCNSFRVSWRDLRKLGRTGRKTRKLLFASIRRHLLEPPGDEKKRKYRSSCLQKIAYKVFEW
jgi:hypothetical protein